MKHYIPCHLKYSTKNAKMRKKKLSYLPALIYLLCCSEVSLEKAMATHSSILAWRIPGTEEPDGLPSVGSHTVGNDWRDLAAAAAAVKYLSTRFARLLQEGFERGKSAVSSFLTQWVSLSTLICGVVKLLTQVPNLPCWSFELILALLGSSVLTHGSNWKTLHL